MRSELKRLLFASGQVQDTGVLTLDGRDQCLIFGDVGSYGLQPGVSGLKVAVVGETQARLKFGLLWVICCPMVS